MPFYYTAVSKLASEDCYSESSKYWSISDLTKNHQNIGFSITPPVIAPKAHFRVPAQTTEVGFWSVLDIYISLSRRVDRCSLSDLPRRGPQRFDLGLNLGVSTLCELSEKYRVWGLAPKSSKSTVIVTEKTHIERRCWGRIPPWD